MNSKYLHKPGGPLGVATGVAALVLALCGGGAQAASVSGSAKVDAGLGKVSVKGKAAGLAPGSWVSIYDADSNIRLYTAKTDGKRKFNVTLQNGGVPCRLRLETGDGGKLLIPVGGADASCKKAAACSIQSPAGDVEISEGQSVEFAAAAKAKKKVTLDYLWTVSDGSEPSKTSNFSHQFNHAGQYRVMLNVADSTGNQCADDVVVRVVPPNANPYPKVSERPAPATAEALNAADGAYVVMPFEETGMQGGSQVTLPYNPLIPYNTLNAQVFKKVKQKPAVVDPSELDVFYSAASNPKDPVGSDSINSTSQNRFSTGESGANWDLAQTTGSQTVLIGGHNFGEATLRKTEMWDKADQPNSDLSGKPKSGKSMAEQQSTYTPAKPMMQLDEGIRGNADEGAGVRKMPGAANPYQANDPQQISAYDNASKTFLAQFLPASDVDDKGRVNPYPLFRVEAKEKGGNVVAKTDAVFSTASETRCRECHARGKVAADDSVWRTPVQETELANGDGSPGAATGAGSFSAGNTGYNGIWPPAIHNVFNVNAYDPLPPNKPATYLLSGAVPADASGLRTDRVVESRTGADGKLQIRLKFKDAAEYGDPDDWVAQEKAALFNTLVLHDYMVKYSPTGTISSQIADLVEDKLNGSRGAAMYFCSSHHTSQLKFDAGVAGRSYPSNRSDYSRAFHAFHGKMQVYAQDVSSSESADGQEHKKGDLIRDGRGHPLMFGGRGWDSQHDDNNGVPIKSDGSATSYAWDAGKNDWAPDQFPMHGKGELLYQFGESVAQEENCAKCHTGHTEKAYRDIHYASGLKCDNCHGDMLAVGNAYSSHRYDANLSGAGAYVGDSIHFRRPWLDEPDCGSCHVGDGNRKDPNQGFFSAGVKKTAWQANDPAKASVFPDDVRFAVMPIVETRKEKSTDASGNTVHVDKQVSVALFRKSKDVHGTGSGGAIACSACHGGSHAIWPNADPDANDNVTAKQLQGYDGNIAECSVCHVKDDFKEGLVATDGGASNKGVAQGVREGQVVDATSARAYLAGPHGMHPVNDPYWWKEAASSAPNGSGTRKGGWHNDFAKKPGPFGEDQCAACHGSDHKGTRLSKTLTAREFVNEKGKVVKVAANTPIGCNLCHSLQKSFTGVPTGQPQAYPPPTPSPIHGGGDGGGGGHGH